MALRTIVKDGDPILKKVCRPVTKFDDRLATLLDDMQDTLVDADGLGLAGPQVGMMRRIFICLDDRNRPEDAPADYKDTFIEFINPEIEYLSDETVELYEGCLSFPGEYGIVRRPLPPGYMHRSSRFISHTPFSCETMMACKMGNSSGQRG
mgnify:CR=1 FL=1